MADKVSVWVVPNTGFGYINIVTGTFINITDVNGSFFPTVDSEPLGNGYETSQACQEALTALVSKIGEIEII